MFSFGELLLIALVSLLVIGPRRLPETVRFVALQAGRLRQTMTATRKMVEDELGMDDIRRQLHNEQVMRSLNATRDQIERAAKGSPPVLKNDKPLDSARQVEAPSDADSDFQVDAGNRRPDSSIIPYTPGASDASDIASPVSEQSNPAEDAAPAPDARSSDNKTS